MKKIFVFVSAIVLLTSCEKSKKGKWIKSEKEIVKKEIKEGFKSMNFDETLTGVNSEKFCDCITDKIEKKFESYSELAKTPVSERAKFGSEAGLECSSELIK
jgi:hypothetical protein